MRDVSLRQSGVMQHTLSRSFIFEAAHTLDRPDYASSSKRIHGHTYRASIYLQGQVNADSGMLLDLSALDQHVQSVRHQLDHQFLDDVAGLGAATLENLCSYIWQQLETVLPGLAKVSVERGATGDACSLSLLSSAIASHNTTAQHV